MPGRRTSVAARDHTWPVLAGILILTTVVFSSAFANGFLNWDDPANVTQNIHIRAITWDAARAWFTTPLLGMYSPLVYLSYAIDFRVGQLDPFVYHLTNLLLHLFNAALVLLIARRLTGTTPLGALVAVLFAIHPVNVAAVTPVSVRSSLLCSALYLSAYLAYLRHLGPHSPDRAEQARPLQNSLWLSWLLFSLAVLAKSAAVVFPLLLVATDWYYRKPLTRRGLLEKVPFLAVAVVFGILGFAFREDTAAMVQAPGFTFWQRLFLAAYSIVCYVGELVAPVRLSAYYPYPQEIGGQLPPAVYVAPIALGIVVWLAARVRATRRLVVFGALLFLIHLALVLKVIPLGAEWMADRYLYLASIGGFLVVADLYGQAPRPVQRWAMLGIGLAVAVLSVAAYQRNGRWKDDMTFYGDIIAKYPNASIAYSNRAAARLREAGDAAAAVTDCENAVRLDPSYADAYFNCATAKMMLRRSEDALRDANAALAINPRRAEYFQVRADAKLAVGDYTGAIADSDRAIALDPHRAEIYMAYVSRGIARISIGDSAGALEDFNTAIRLNPTVAVVYQNRANARAMAGDNPGAMADYEAALARDPSLATVYYYRGLLKQKLANPAGSCEDFRAAAVRGVAAAQPLLAQSCR